MKRGKYIFENNENIDRYGSPTLSENYHFHNLDEIPFKIFVKGYEFIGTITPTGYELAEGYSSAFQVCIPLNPVVTICKENGVWVMPASEEFVLELGVWIELHYQ